MVVVEVQSREVNRQEFNVGSDGIVLCFPPDTMTGLKLRCQQAASFWGLQGRIIFPAYASFYRPPAFLGSQSLLPSSKTATISFNDCFLCHIAFWLTLTLFLSFLKALSLLWDNLPFPRSLIISAKSLLPCKLTILNTGDQDLHILVVVVVVGGGEGGLIRLP